MHRLIRLLLGIEVSLYPVNAVDGYLDCDHVDQDVDPKASRVRPHEVASDDMPPNLVRDIVWGGAHGSIPETLRRNAAKPIGKSPGLRGSASGRGSWS